MICPWSDSQRFWLPTWQPLCENMSSTVHRLINGDARDLSFLDDASVHLVVTSPPYWNLKRYNENPEQMGHIQNYETFLRELEKAWRHVFRVLVPGGRLWYAWSVMSAWPDGILDVTWCFPFMRTFA
jgi:DNA modification methylase